MAKAVNYTPEMTQELVSAYEAAKANDSQESCADVVVRFAEAFGRSIPSIRQKLVREGVYEKKEYVSKNGAKPETKGEIVLAIAESLGVSEEVAESLGNANKAILIKLREALS